MLTQIYLHIRFRQRTGMLQSHALLLRHICFKTVELMGLKKYSSMFCQKELAIQELDMMIILSMEP